MGNEHAALCQLTRFQAVTEHIVNTAVFLRCFVPFPRAQEGSMAMRLVSSFELKAVELLFLSGGTPTCENATFVLASRFNKTPYR